MYRFVPMAPVESDGATTLVSRTPSQLRNAVGACCGGAAAEDALPEAALAFAAALSVAIAGGLGTRYPWDIARFCTGDSGPGSPVPGFVTRNSCCANLPGSAGTGPAAAKIARTTRAPATAKTINASCILIVNARVCMYLLSCCFGNA